MTLLSCSMKNGLTRLMGSNKPPLALTQFMLMSMDQNFKSIGFEKMIFLLLRLLFCGRKLRLLIVVFPLDYVVFELNSFLNTVVLASVFNDAVSAYRVHVYYVMNNLRMEIMSFDADMVACVRNFWKKRLSCM